MPKVALPLHAVAGTALAFFIALRPGIAEGLSTAGERPSFWRYLYGHGLVSIVT